MEKKKNLRDKKRAYVKPVLTKHRKLKDVTAGTTGMIFGCTRRW